MSTWRELVYMVLDNEKISSDDSYITEDHIIYTLDKVRATILKQAYKDIRNIPSEKNYQVINIPLIRQGDYLTNSITDYSIPIPLEIGKVRAFSTNYNLEYFGEVTIVSRDRFKYVGSNKYLQNIIYGTISTHPYKSIYLKCNNPQFYYIEEISLSAIFSSAREAYDFGTSGSEVLYSEFLDSEFPISEELIPVLIKAVVEVFHPIVYKPEDKKNNGNDDLSKVAVSKGDK